MRHTWLLTGATGLVGQYLLQDLLCRGESVAVLVRTRRRKSPAVRLEEILTFWEHRLGRSLPRPTLIEGDLREPGLGLSEFDRKWCQRQLTAVLHSAASLSFTIKSDGEPVRSVVHGTRSLLELCDASRVREFHHISTGYVCGKIDGVAQEVFHGEFAPFGNIYEQSKSRAEQDLLASTGQFSRTIYRPTIVIGDSKDGFATGFHTIYTPLRLGWPLYQRKIIGETGPVDMMAQLGLQGDESKNVVTIDWVTETISRLVQTPRTHGDIYQLSNPEICTAADLLRIMVDTALEVAPPDIPLSSFQPLEARTLGEFEWQMQAYRSHFRHDPVFVRTKLDATGVAPACPRVDELLLRRAFAYALAAKFRDPMVAADAAAVAWQSRWHAAVRPPLGSPTLRLEVIGAGGGTWDLSGQGHEWQVSRPSNGPATCQLTGPAAAVRAWLAGESLGTLLDAGQLALFGAQEALVALKPHWSDVRHGLNVLINSDATSTATAGQLASPSV